MRLAAVTFSRQGLKICRQLERSIAGLQIFLHQGISAEGVTPFSRIMEWTPQQFGHFDGLIFVAPCGVVVRSLAGCPQSKYKDPAVVVVDAGGRDVVSLLSGHEGGANALAIRVANLIGAEPVITTTTEAIKNLIVGIGCRKGKSQQEIVSAVKSVLLEQNLDIHKVRYLASAAVKAEEKGLLAAAHELNIPLRIIANENIRNCLLSFTESEFVKTKVDLPAVAEPAALLAGRRTQLIVKKQARNGITIAVAQENCMSLA
jgi:cobalt-precorrin 5A hydrolase